MTARFVQFTDGGLPRDVSDALARIRSAPDVLHVAVMPDVHLADDVCVGTVVATSRLIYPAAVGGDIGCGMLAARFEASADAVDERAAARILAGLYERIPRDRHWAAGRAPWPDDLDETSLSSATLVALARHEGRAELGTLGSGNHFVELQRDDAGQLWAMLHSGSRAIGPAVRDAHLRVIGAGGLGSLEAESVEGKGYLGDMAWAMRYAAANRRLLLSSLVDVIRGVLGAGIDERWTIACHHNHVRQEVHGGSAYWVHRKGAISAAAGERGIIPGSMGSTSYHVEGRGNSDALASAAHGAGRRMSRAEARRRISQRTLSTELAGVFWDRRRAAVLRDEAPGAYKDIGRVMRAQHELVRIVRRLTPILAYKGA
jgi:tRNA-splicing ligase RtcB